MALFGAQVRQTDSLDAARETFLQTIEGVVTTPPTKEEVERARASLLKNIELSLNSSEQIGLEPERVDGPGRLAFVLPAP